MLAEGGTQEVCITDYSSFSHQQNDATVGTGAIGLAGVDRGQRTGHTGALDYFVLFGRSMGHSQAAVELQVSSALLL